VREQARVVEANLRGLGGALEEDAEAFVLGTTLGQLALGLASLVDRPLLARL
jgi:hypothetical protein